MTNEQSASLLTKILGIIGVAARVAEPFVAPLGPEATTVDQAVEALTAIAQKANAAHVALTGEPIDLDQLQPIAPVE